MEAALRNPNVPVVGYFWALALSAFLCRAQETLGYTALAIACALIVPPAAGFHVDGVALTTNVLVLALIGVILAHLSHTTRQTQAELDRERTFDASALRIAELVHSSVNLNRVLSLAVEELGKACGAARAVLRLAQTEQGWPGLLQWQRPGLAPLEHFGPPEPIERIFATGEPLVVDDVSEADPQTRTALEGADRRSVVGLPVRWQGRVIAVLGLQDSVPRRWSAEALPLLERALPQVAAALAQAELFEQQQATLDRLEDLNTLREELVAQVSHELRTPLTSTLGFLYTLERSDLDLDAAERLELLKIARAEAERLAVLVDDLLQLASFDRGTVELELAPISLGEVVERAAGVLTMPEGRGLRVDLDGGLVAHGDEQRLLQVFSNLLTNAIRYGEGDVLVQGEAKGDDVAVSVCDDGPGVPANRRADLFVPFARWGHSHESTGLGLAIAQGIVRAHDGTLEYRPPAGGRPHAFVVTLPREPVRVAARPQGKLSTA